MLYEIKRENDFQYIEEGNGPVLLLLHGLFGALSNWNDVIRHFSSSYRIVIPLMPIYTLPILNTNVKALSEFVFDFIAFKGKTASNGSNWENQALFDFNNKELPAMAVFAQ